MKKIGDFFKRIRVSENNKPITENNNIQEFQIHIEGNLKFFKDEEEKIIQGAKELMKSGGAKNMEDAIITIAVMFRGLRYSETKKAEDGRTVIVLKETIQETIGIPNDNRERDR